ncbi:MAG: autotransporter domain-containing protein, partial [Planctomycetaceae bacterium]|nr:autotransporter domain-containing protein [Planctomycetaceae bacterium]
TTQFLNGDAVEFIGGNGSQVISVDYKGIRIADQPRAAGNIIDTNPIAGMIVDNAITQDFTFTGGSIGGTGSLLKKGTGKLIFEQSNSFTGLTTIEEGTVVLKKSDSLGTEGGVNVKKDGTLNFAISGSGEFTQVITGDVGSTILKTGNGSVVLTEASPNFKGGVDIQNGELGIADIRGVGSAAVNTGSGGTFALLSDSGTFNNAITGNGKVRVGDGADIVLSGTKTYRGGTTVDRGSKLTISQLENVGTGSIAVNGTLNMLFANNQTVKDRNITGTSLIEKNGAGRLDFESATDFSGTFRLNTGGILLTNNRGLQNATLDYKNGTVDFGTNSEIYLGGLAGGSDIALANNSGNGVALTVGSNGSDQVFTGKLSGSGSFIKTGEGTQVLDGVNSYTGGTLISGGRLAGTDVESFGTGSVVNNSELEFRIGAGKSQTYDKVLAGTGMLIKNGAGILTLTEINPYTGGTHVEDGTLNVTTLQSLGMNTQGATAPEAGTVIISEGAVLSLDIDAATTDTADVSITKNIGGNGTLVKTGSGVVSLDTDVTFTGKIDVQRGTFYLNANTASAVDVRNGATLSGLGTVDNLVHFYNGSIHRVDNRSREVLGLFRAKDIQYDSGSTIYIKVGANGSDRIVADNQLNFAKEGGNVNVRFINFAGETSDDADPLRYEVFSSASGLILVGGHVLQEERGDTTTINGGGTTSAGVQLIGEGARVLGYEVARTGGTAKGIFVDVLLDGVFDSTFNSNQKSVLSGIGSVSVLDAFFDKTGEARQGMLNELTPMVQTALPYLNNRSITHFNESVFNRLRFLSEPVHQPVLHRNEVGYNLSPTPLYRGAPRDDKFKRALWFQNYGDFILMQEDGSRPEFRINSYGFAVGSDCPIDRCASVGIGMGGNFANVSVNKFGQKADVDSFLVSAYGNWFTERGWMLTSSIGIAANQCDAKRSVYSLGTQIDSSHTGTSFWGSIESSKKFRFNCFDVSPFAGLDFIWLTEKGYGERLAFGNPDLPLGIAKNRTNSALSTMGLRVGRTFRLLGGNVISPTAYMAWVHDYNVSEVNTWAWFPGQDGFTVTGASMFRDRAKVGTNLDMTLSNRLSMYARFDAELGRRMSDLSVQWGIQLGY